MEEKEVPAAASEDRLGVRLRRLREERGASIRDVARELKTSPVFVEALEQGTYANLPAKIYALGFLKKILSLARVPDQQEWIVAFEREWEAFHSKTRERDSLRHAARARGVRITPRLIVGALLLALLFVISGFVGLRIRRFARAPSLVIDAPDDRSALKKPVVRVGGSTDRETRLTVNGRELRINAQGGFGQELELLPGVNELEFLAQNRFGKETRAVRYVVVE
ncbi:MAG: helix-turn-helix domain-containing protein [Candidatus Sungbacteria bacterium]|nr:helix-turn-helix domain-containing protein [Candidatus Sungbacteria bacterium]